MWDDTGAALERMGTWDCECSGVHDFDIYTSHREFE